MPTRRFHEATLTLFLIGLSLLLPAGAVLGQAASSRIWPDLEAGPFPVGYTVRHEYDYSRTFKKKYDFFGQRTPGEIARPIQISLWYPAEAPDGDERVRVRDYYHATATETGFTPPGEERLIFSLQELARILTMEWAVSPEDQPETLRQLDSVFGEETFAWRDARPAPGPFPLVLHLPGYNASPNHFHPLFEYLASHGYVVAAVPSMGAYSREIDHEGMSMDVQARDLEFVLSVARTLPFVDPGRVATTGMSWGGMSNVLFASRNDNVDAVVTFDGAITMPAELDLLEQVPGFELGSLRGAYLQLMVAPEEAVFRPKDLRFWDALRYSDAIMLQFHQVGHDDFAPGNLRLRLSTEGDPARKEYLEGFSRTLLGYTLEFLDASTKGDAGALSFLAATPEENGVPAGLVALWESKEGIPPPPTQEEFAGILRSSGVEAAEGVFRAVREREPELEIITSPLMGPLYMEAFQAGELDRALAICRLWALGMPEDVGPWFSMARVYRAMGNKEGAIDAYEKVLEIAPDHPAAANARAAIVELRGG
jgi:dienelactone hydrolase